jgi:hypothetical protein
MRASDVWGAACAVFATVLRNFAAYAASLAGFTAAVIASDQLGATGGPNGDAFMLAITRVSEIWIGIKSAGVVLAGTDFGAARRRLAAVFATVSAQIVDGFGSTLTQLSFNVDHEGWAGQSPRKEIDEHSKKRSGPEERCPDSCSFRRHGRRSLAPDARQPGSVGAGHRRRRAGRYRDPR